MPTRNTFLCSLNIIRAFFFFFWKKKVFRFFLEKEVEWKTKQSHGISNAEWSFVFQLSNWQHLLSHFVTMNICFFKLNYCQMQLETNETLSSLFSVMCSSYKCFLSIKFGILLGSGSIVVSKHGQVRVRTNICQSGFFFLFFWYLKKVFRC